MHADFELDSNGVARPAGHGGARAGAGRKPPGYQKPAESVAFDKARARNEEAKAALNELELKVKTGEYVARVAVQQASATVIATFAQTLRSIGDNLERKGVSTAVCQQVEQVIDEALASLASDLEMMSGGDA